MSSRASVTQPMIWSAGKKRLIELTAAEERAIIVRGGDEAELLALAHAAKEAAVVLRERLKQAKAELS